MWAEKLRERLRKATAENERLLAKVEELQKEIERLKKKEKFNGYL